MKRIIIVDDREDTRHLLRALLEGHGHTVEEARHGAEALVRIRLAPPDLIISDLMMPIMDGFTLCQTCKSDSQLRHIPFVFFTAAVGNLQAEETARHVGADAFILNPVPLEELALRFEELLSRT